MPIWILERRVVNVIEQRNYLDEFGFEKRLPEVRVGARLDLERRVVNVIEQRNYLDSSVFEKITGSKGRCPIDFSNVELLTLLNNVTTSTNSVLKKGCRK